MPPRRRAWELAAGPRAVKILAYRDDLVLVRSGFAVSPSHVLTVGHGSVPLGDCKIQVAAGGEPWPARVVIDSAADVALLEIEGAAPWSDLSPVPWGRPNGEEPIVGYALGYPAAAGDTIARGRSQPAISIRPLSDDRGRRELVVMNGEPASPDLWSGMSGAPVIAEGRLVGIVQDASTLHSSGVLYGRTSEQILEAVDSNGNRLADIVSPQGTAVAVPVRPLGSGSTAVQLAPPVRPLPANPTDLQRLYYGHAAVPYVAQPDLDVRLDQWLNGTGFEVGLLTGRGGAGKSRAAQRLCLSAAAHGWDAGYVWPGDSNWSSRGVAPDRDLLAVVDYPEEHPRRVGLWIHQLKAAAEASGCRVRVLLLARSIEGWWFRPLVDAQDLDDPIAVSDQGHHDPRATLVAQYAAARAAFGTDALPLAAEAAAGLSTSLEAHVLALVGGGGKQLLRRVLDREAAGWAAQWSQTRILDRLVQDEPGTPALTVAALTLVPCGSDAEAQRALEAAGLETAAASAAAAWFSGLYGPGFAPLVPDPVADLLLVDLLEQSASTVAAILAHLDGDTDRVGWMLGVVNRAEASKQPGGGPDRSDPEPG